MEPLVTLGWPIVFFLFFETGFPPCPLVWDGIHIWLHKARVAWITRMGRGTCNTHKHIRLST